MPSLLCLFPCCANISLFLFSLFISIFCSLARPVISYQTLLYLGPPSSPLVNYSIEPIKAVGCPPPRLERTPQTLGCSQGDSVSLLWASFSFKVFMDGGHRVLGREANLKEMTAILTYFCDFPQTICTCVCVHVQEREEKGASKSIT